MSSPLNFDAKSGVDIGLMIASAMWGVTTLQAIQYYRQFFKTDPLYIKVAVIVVWVCATGHIFLQGACFHEIISRRTSGPVVLPTCSASMVFGFVVQAAVQSMYALRIFKFCHRFYVPVFCWIAALYSLVVQTTFALVATGKNIEGFHRLRQKYNWLMSSGYTIAAVVDLMITFAFCCLLHMNRDFVKLRTKRVLDILCLLSIENGLITSITAITIVVLFNVEKLHGVFMAFVVVIVHLYSLTMMILLHRRTQLRSINTAYVGLDAIRSLNRAHKRKSPASTVDITANQSHSRVHSRDTGDTTSHNESTKFDESTLVSSEILKYQLPSIDA